MTHSMLGVRRGHSIGGLIRQRRTLMKKIRRLSLFVRSQGTYIVALKGETMLPNKKKPPMTVVEQMQATMVEMQALCERYEQEDLELRTVLAIEQERARLAGLELAQLHASLMRTPRA